MHSSIGKQGQDKITGLTGIIIGRVEYITGCNQLLLQPGVKHLSEFQESHWIDEQRISILLGETIKLDNGPSAPGFDKAAPRL